MQALEFTVPVADIITEAHKEGLLIITAGTNIIRIVPPLIINEKNIAEMKEKLDKAKSRAVGKA